MPYLWHRPGAYSEQLQSFGQRAFEALLTRTDARVWVGEVAGTMVGFLVLAKEIHLRKLDLRRFDGAMGNYIEGDFR